MKEPIFIEEAVKHACVDLILLFDLRYPIPLEGFNELSYLLIYLVWLG